jgi:DNA-directed RNA polymerase specialized sigma24 family protein
MGDVSVWIEKIYGDKDALREAIGLYWDLETRAASQSRDSSHFMDFSRDLKDAILSLPKGHRQVLALNVMMGYTVREVGEIVGRPKSTVIDMVSQSLDGIQAYLEGRRNGYNSR